MAFDLMFSNLEILLRFFKNLFQSPVFAFAQRTRFCDRHQVANAALILFIMRHERGSFLDELTVLRVLNLTFNIYHDAFIHLVADHDAGLFLAQISFFGLLFHSSRFEM